MLALLAFAPAPARAHQASTSYSDIRVRDDGAVAYTLKLSSRDLAPALGLPDDRDATDEEIRRGEGALFAYVLARVHLADGARPCPFQPHGLVIVHQAERFVALELAARCPAPLERVVITYDLFFDLDPRHVGMARLVHGDTAITHDFSRGLNRYEWKLAGNAPDGKGFLAWAWIGVLHIFTGYDHVCFLIGLLLCATIRLGPTGEWEPRAPREGALHVLGLVTAFTVAHSFTLIVAALDLLSLPSRFVESAIAASIVYVAAENVVARAPRSRWPVGFVFGLVHGLGFAASLRELLPTSGVVIPLLEMNLGVELGQLAIVAAVYPALVALSRLGARGYRRYVVVGGGVILSALGALWLAERVLGVPLLAGALG